MANSKPPLPPPAVAYLCELTEEQGKTNDSAGPQVTQDQLVSAFAKMIPPNDTKEVFEEKVRSRYARAHAYTQTCRQWGVYCSVGGDLDMFSAV